MATKNIIKLLEKGNVTKDLKVAYSFMLLSRGYSADEIKALDDYDFLIRKKSSKITGETNQMDVATPRNRKQRSLPKNPVCLTSTSEAYNNRDHTLYSLNGEAPVTKGRLVWSIIKLYQEQHNPTCEEVSQLFNRKMPRGQVDDTSALESEIDRLVYHLYGLTYDEVLIVDPETPITREEYETYQGNE